MTIQEIISRNTAAGNKFFDSAQMLQGYSRVSSKVHEGPGGIFFVTSEPGYDDVRRWSVRQFYPETASIRTAAWQKYADNRRAQNAAKIFARMKGPDPGIGEGAVMNAPKRTPGLLVYHSGMVWAPDGPGDGIPIAHMDRDTPYTTPTERDANARFIAQAWNAHDDLVTALQQMLRACAPSAEQWAKENGEESLHSSVKNARAALRKAEGGQ